MNHRWLPLLLVTLLLPSACSSSSDPPTASSPPLADSGSDGKIILDAGGGIADPPDGAALCPSGECNYQTPQGCAPSMACQPNVADGGIEPSCSPAGTALAGAPCKTWADCVAGTTCAGELCRTLCCGGDWSPCPKNERCFTTVSLQVNGAPSSTGAMVCMPTSNCNVLDGSGCPAERFCHIIDGTGATACIHSGTGKTADKCPCAAGFSCIGSVCRKLCRAVAEGGEPSCSDTEGLCVHFNRDPPNVGECTL